MGGPKVDTWILRQYEWLDEIDDDLTLLPHNMNTWQVLEAEFKQAFVNYAMHERAQDKLRKLKMKEGNVNEYIAQFTSLVHRAGMDPNDPSTMRLFAQGLPKGLADSCININSPETFVEWTKAAQRHHRNWLKKQSIHKDYASTNQHRQPQ